MSTHCGAPTQGKSSPMILFICTVAWAKLIILGLIHIMSQLTLLHHNPSMKQSPNLPHTPDEESIESLGAVRRDYNSFFTISLGLHIYWGCSNVVQNIVVLSHEMIFVRWVWSD